MSDYVPNSYQTPNVYVDKLMYYLTSAEYKVLMLATREILGWQDKIAARRARISRSVFMDGKEINGRRVCFGTGLSANAIKRALDFLDAAGILIKEGDPNRDGQEYRLQDNGDGIDWALLEKRDREQRSAGRERTKAASSAAQEVIVGRSGKERIVERSGTPIVGRSGTGSSDDHKETHEKQRKQRGAARSTLFADQGIKVEVEQGEQYEYVDVLLAGQTSDFYCPRCNEVQDWPGARASKKKREQALACSACGVRFRIELEDTGDTFCLTESHKHAIISMNGIALECTEQDARTFVKLLKENAGRMFRVIDWAKDRSGFLSKSDAVRRLIKAWDTFGQDDSGGEQNDGGHGVQKTVELVIKRAQ